ncbi:molecular chaperone [Erwinia aphidicola]|uniref:fimbrial biogenesis chaperone n=1 Tax=Erwinia aphidicola TaxID=68334 RepID=UPI003019611F
MFSKLKTFCVAAAILSTAQFASAGVIVGGTRVIYNAAQKETSIAVRNPEKATPYLMQSWVENASPTDTSKVPFIITPPLFRLDAGQENTLRIVRTGGQLPEDRESLYWLNIKSIPASSKADTNQLQISVKTRIKLIYRPASLVANAPDAYKKLTFSRRGNQLQVTNPTAYQIAFYRVKVGGVEIKEPGSITPFGTLSLPLPVGASGQVSWQTINDFGGITPAESKAL